MGLKKLKIDVNLALLGHLGKKIPFYAICNVYDCTVQRREQIGIGPILLILVHFLLRSS